MPVIPWAVQQDPTFEAARIKSERQLGAISGLAQAGGSLLRLKRGERHERQERQGNLARLSAYDEAMYYDAAQKAQDQSEPPAGADLSGGYTDAETGRPVLATPGAPTMGGQHAAATAENVSENDHQPPAAPAVTSSGTALNDVQSSVQQQGSSPVPPPPTQTQNNEPPPATKVESSETKPTPPPAQEQGALSKLATAAQPVTKPLTAAASDVWSGIKNVGGVLKPDKYTLGEWADIFGAEDPYRTQEIQRIGTLLGHRDVVEGEQRRLGTILQYGRPLNPSTAIPKLAPHAFGGLDLSGIQWTDWNARHNATMNIFQLAKEAAGNDPAKAIDIYTGMMTAIRAAGNRLPWQQAMFQYLNSLPEGPEKQHAIATAKAMQSAGMFAGYNPLMEEIAGDVAASNAPQQQPQTAPGTDWMSVIGKLAQALGITIPGFGNEPPPTGGGGRGAGNIAEIRSNPIALSPLWGKYSRMTNVPPGLGRAVAWQESGFNPGADSGSARGLMQFAYNNPENVANSAKYGITDQTWKDPEAQIRAGMSYLGDLYKQTGDWRQALVLYHGVGADSLGMTGERYADEVLAKWHQLEEAGIGTKDGTDFANPPQQAGGPQNPLRTPEAAAEPKPPDRKPTVHFDPNNYINPPNTGTATTTPPYTPSTPTTQPGVRPNVFTPEGPPASNYFDPNQYINP